MKKNKDSILDKYLRIVLGTSVSSFVCSLLMLLGIRSLPLYYLVSISSITLTYYGVFELKKRLDKKFDLDMYRADQLIKSLSEIGTYDKTIELGKNYFWNEIELAARKRSIELSYDNKNILNQLLYMINENYYDLINKMGTLTRDELVTKVLDIAIYYIENNNSTLNDDDIDNIIDALFFLDDEIKKQMKKEFKMGKCIMDKHIDYRIISKNLNRDNLLNANTLINKGDYVPYFDYDDIKSYEIIINRYDEKKYFIQYGDSKLISWNISLLKDIITMIIIEFDDELKKDNIEYTPIDFASLLIYNLGIYCLVNKKYDITPYEIANVFKKWDYVSFSLKLDIVNRIYEKYGLDMNQHPFEIKQIKQPSLEKKIIKFPK